MPSFLVILYKVELRVCQIRIAPQARGCEKHQTYSKLPHFNLWLVDLLLDMIRWDEKLFNFSEKS